MGSELLLMAMYVCICNSSSSTNCPSVSSAAVGVFREDDFLQQYRISCCCGYEPCSSTTIVALAGDPSPKSKAQPLNACCVLCDWEPRVCVSWCWGTRVMRIGGGGGQQHTDDDFGKRNLPSQGAAEQCSPISRTPGVSNCAPLPLALLAWLVGCRLSCLFPRVYSCQTKITSWHKRRKR